MLTEQQNVVKNIDFCMKFFPWKEKKRKEKTLWGPPFGLMIRWISYDSMVSQ